MADLYAVVQRHMKLHDISLRALARAVHHDPSYLSKALRGLKPCGPKLARDIDDALAAGGDIIQAAASRRDIPAHQEAPVAPELVGYFRSQLAGHYTADMYLGPLHLIPTVQTQAELIARLVSAADAPVRRDLLDTGAAYAALLGWLYQDAGDLVASARWRDSTLSLAHRSGDAQLISYALTNKAMLALDQGDGRAVADYAQAALAGERILSAKARVLALQHQAQGYAMLGDRAAADRLLDQAALLVDSVDDEYLWGNSCRRTPHHIEVQRATAYGRTKQPQDSADAAGLWDQIMDVMPESARRDNAVFRARQASVLARVPDPDRAVWAATKAAGAVRATGSARLRRELKALPREASGWAHTTAGRELRDIVASIA
jgi:tetratricopeptide (TPR) repeat protein